ncbi:MAG TPA: prephenate dehydratase domain-containing protein, partial [Chitinophagaceae bacterium]|nr:prephenate dehydratase domain-containing protein [Chitinophagaceae bacterium]
ADFLDKYHWKLVETTDTASSARYIRQHNCMHIAAIAGKLAAELFELKALVPNIHTMKSNYTRFLVLQREELAEEIADADKASVNFHTDHSRGSLARVLTTIADGGINLSKLQSLPIPGSDWKYSFHADMEFDSREQLEMILKRIKPVTEAVRVYGVYRKGKG